MGLKQLMLQADYVKIRLIYQYNLANLTNRMYSSDLELTLKMTSKPNLNKNIAEPKSIRYVVLFWLLIISFSSGALLTLYTVQVQYRNFKSESRFFRERYRAEQKTLLKQKVDEAVAYVKYNSDKTKARLEQDIKSRVYGAWSIADHLYKIYDGKFTDEQIAFLIKETLRPIRFNEGRGYFFIVSLKGVEELYPSHPEFEGKNLIDLQDLKGKYVIKDEIKTVENHDQGFVSGYWPNPTVKSDKSFLQYCFVKKFKPLNWLIGTGEFLDNVEQDIKSETLQWLAGIRYGNDSYIFADTYQGDALLMDGKIVTDSQNIWDLQDPNGIKVIQEETRIAKSNPEGGYLSYSWKRSTGDVPIPVLSFVKAVPEWDWVVGSCLYVDDIEKAISLQEDRLKKNVINDIKLILLGFLVSIPIITLVSILISRKFNREFDVFLSFFKYTRERTKEIDLKELTIKEFCILAEATNSMICKRREAEEKLELLSRIDPLTGLSNRRDMTEKIKLEHKRFTRTGDAFSFVIADIDNFKSVNDLYGHDTGDAILKRVANILTSCARQNDIICRWGGEEFLILLPSTVLEGAMAAAEKIRKRIQDEEFVCSDKRIKTTLTCGVSTMCKEMSPNQAIAVADYGLLKGKREGKNRVIVGELEMQI